MHDDSIKVICGYCSIKIQEKELFRHLYTEHFVTKHVCRNVDFLTKEEHNLGNKDYESKFDRFMLHYFKCLDKRKFNYLKCSKCGKRAWENPAKYLKKPCC